ANSVTAVRLPSTSPATARIGNLGAPGSDIRHSFNDFVSAGEQRRRHGEAKSLGSLEIEQQLKCRWLLDRQVSRYCAFENFVDVCGGALMQVEKARAVSQQN